MRSNTASGEYCQPGMVHPAESTTTNPDMEEIKSDVLQLGISTLVRVCGLA